MIARAAKLIGEEWRTSLFFVGIILVLGGLSTYVFQNFIIRGIFFCFGIWVYNSYFLYLGRALKGERTPSPYKFILFGKDKARYDFFILGALFSAILMLLYGPLALVEALFGQKLRDFLASITFWAIFFNIAILIGFTMYKIVLYAAVSSLTYHRHEVLEAFKNGMRGIWRFKGLLALLVIHDIAVLFLLGMTRGIMPSGVVLISYVIPAAIMFLMSCSYSLAESPIVAEAVPADVKQPIPSKGIE